MKVYLVLEDYTCEFIEDLRIKAFSTLEKAQKYFKETIKQVKIDFMSDYVCNEEDIIIEEKEKIFKIYFEGYYSQEHTKIQILEKDIQ